MREIILIAAMDKNRLIGSNGTLPWHLKKDFAWFVKNTIGKTIVMGRKNYEDIIRFTKGKPLKDRKNIILTRQMLLADGFIIEHDIDSIMAYPEDLVIIGGTEIYTQFMPFATTLILTEIDHQFEGDTFFPSWEQAQFYETYRETQEENGLKFDFVIYKKSL